MTKLIIALSLLMFAGGAAVGNNIAISNISVTGQNSIDHLP